MAVGCVSAGVTPIILPARASRVVCPVRGRPKKRRFRSPPDEFSKAQLQVLRRTVPVLPGLDAEDVPEPPPEHEQAEL